MIAINPEHGKVLRYSEVVQDIYICSCFFGSASSVLGELSFLQTFPCVQLTKFSQMPLMDTKYQLLRSHSWLGHHDLCLCFIVGETETQKGTAVVWLSNHSGSLTTHPEPFPAQPCLSEVQGCEKGLLEAPIISRFRNFTGDQVECRIHMNSANIY